MGNTSKGYEDDDDVEVEGTIEARTDKAWLVNDGKTKAWVPKSQIVSFQVKDKQNCTEIVMPYWLAKDKGFI